MRTTCAVVKSPTMKLQCSAETLGEYTTSCVGVFCFLPRLYVVPHFSSFDSMWWLQVSELSKNQHDNVL